MPINVPASLVPQFVNWVAEYIDDQRQALRDKAKPIPADLQTTVSSFFPSDVLSKVHIVQGRVSDPAFYSQLRSLGIRNAPSFSDMAGITFVDVVLHVEELSSRLLFHELVHAVQYKHLGLKGFADRYVRGFLQGGSYEKIPLELQAYELEAKFAKDPKRFFSVEEDVLSRARQNQF